MTNSTTQEIAKLSAQGRKFALALGVLPLLFLVGVVSLAEASKHYALTKQQESNGYLLLCLIWLVASLFCSIMVTRVFRRIATLNDFRDGSPQVTSF